MLKVKVSCRWIATNSRLKSPKMLMGNVDNNPKIKITDSDRKLIADLPFFEKSMIKITKSTKYVNNSKKDYIKNKLLLVNQIFGEDPINRGYISYGLPKSLPIPFYDAIALRRFDPIEGKLKNFGTDRLSVTKLLTKKWCELREAYDIYSRLPIFEHAQVKGGKVDHLKLEDETHPISQDWKTFVREFEMDIPSDPFHTYVEKLFDCSSRLLSMFVDGEAREVLCHGYLDSRTGSFIKDKIKDDEDILVSGVIDHLILGKRDKTSKVKSKNIQPVKLGELLDIPQKDIQETLKWIELNLPEMKETVDISVADVKTRSFKSVPSQNSVVKAAKYQVMYYRYFLSLLGSSAENAYKMILENARRRGFDIYKPVDPAKVFSLMESDSLIIEDMRRIMDGKDIKFPPYDSDPKRYSSELVEYDLSQYSEIITDTRVIQRYGEFFTAWKEPVTIRYFAARLAQLYENVGSLLSDTLMVEYYHRGDNFHNIIFDYDEKKISEQAFDSTNFFFGKRKVEPIPPTISNSIIYCTYCDYESVCSWKKIIWEKNKQLGEELTKLHDSDLSTT